MLHDLRNLLLVIYGRSLEAMAQTPPGDRTMEGILEELTAAVECAVAISKADARELEPVELVSLLADVAPVVRRGVSDAVSVEVLAPASPGIRVQGDRVALTRALLNLSSNANAAMREGGRLTLGLDLVELAGEEPAVPAPLRPGCYARFFVLDTGEAMTETQLARAFEPGYSTRSGADRGSGLTIVAAIAGRHEGGVRASSRPGEGTRFELLIPLAEGHPAS